MNLQIDITPFKNEPKVFKMTQYINDSCYISTITKNEVERLINDGIVAQVYGQRHNDKGVLERFEYPDKVDSAGVQYTSKLFVLTPKN